VRVIRGGSSTDVPSGSARNTGFEPGEGAGGPSATATFRTIGRSDGLPNNYVNPYYLEDLKRRVAVARIGEKLYAFDDLAPNSGCPLSAGLLTATTIMSQCDGSQFDITSGAVRRPQLSRPTRCARRMARSRYWCETGHWHHPELFLLLAFQCAEC
jgi:nitrite reductase/ring-hydroxylating ferredoxin subunit